MCDSRGENAPSHQSSLSSACARVQDNVRLTRPESPIASIVAPPLSLNSVTWMPFKASGAPSSAKRSPGGRYREIGCDGDAVEMTCRSWADDPAVRKPGGPGTRGGIGGWAGGEGAVGGLGGGAMQPPR
eukprot:1957925-Prymnesium_polylepis.1